MLRLVMLAVVVELAAMPPPAEAQARPVDTMVQPNRSAAPRNGAPAARPFGTGTRSRLPPNASRQGLPSPPDRTPATEPAPLPNRDIEAPSGAFTTNRLNPSLEPMVLQPDRRQGLTFGGEHLRETGPDRPFDNIVPGARVRIPFD